MLEHNPSLQSSEAEPGGQGRPDRAERSDPRSGVLDGRAQRSYIAPEPEIRARFTYDHARRARNNSDLSSAKTDHENNTNGLKA